MYKNKEEQLKQHLKAKRYISDAIKEMGLDDFIKFFQTCYKLTNRRSISKENVFKSIEDTPRHMYYVIESAKSEMRRINEGKRGLNDFQTENEVLAND